MKQIVLLILTASALFASVAKISAIRGDAVIIRKGNELKASLNSNLEVNDVIKTGSKARLQIIFKDESITTLGKNSKLNIKDYLLDGSSSRLNLEINSGSFKMISGQIGKLARKNFIIKLRTATLGIRGTVFVGEIRPDLSKVACLRGAISLSMGRELKEVKAGKQLDFSAEKLGKVQAIKLDEFSLAKPASTSSSLNNAESSNDEQQDNSSSSDASDEASSGEVSSASEASNESANNSASEASNESANSSASEASADNKASDAATSDATNASDGSNKVELSAPEISAKAPTELNADLATVSTAVAEKISEQSIKAASDEENHKQVEQNLKAKVEAIEDGKTKPDLETKPELEIKPEPAPSTSTEPVPAPEPSTPTEPVPAPAPEPSNSPVDAAPAPETKPEDAPEPEPAPEPTPEPSNSSAEHAPEPEIGHSVDSPIEPEPVPDYSPAIDPDAPLKAGIFDASKFKKNIYLKSAAKESNEFFGTLDEQALSFIAYDKENRQIYVAQNGEVKIIDIASGKISEDDYKYEAIKDDGGYYIASEGPGRLEFKASINNAEINLSEQVENINQMLALSDDLRAKYIQPPEHYFDFYYGNDGMVLRINLAHNQLKLWDGYDVASITGLEIDGNVLRYFKHANNSKDYYETKFYDYEGSYLADASKSDYGMSFKEGLNYVNVQANKAQTSIKADFAGVKDVGIEYGFVPGGISQGDILEPLKLDAVLDASTKAEFDKKDEIYKDSIDSYYLDDAFRYGASERAAIMIDIAKMRVKLIDSPLINNVRTSFAIDMSKKGADAYSLDDYKLGKKAEFVSNKVAPYRLAIGGSGAYEGVQASADGFDFVAKGLSGDFNVKYDLNYFGNKVSNDLNLKSSNLEEFSSVAKKLGFD